MSIRLFKITHYPQGIGAVGTAILGMFLFGESK